MLDDLKEMPNVDNTEVGLDLGIYFPLDQQTMIGGALIGTGDRYDLTGVGGDAWMQINQYLLGMSGVRYFGSEIGKGFFVRLDAGVSWTYVEYDVLGSKDSETSEKGFGMLGGVGYSFGITEGTRIAVGGDYSFKRIEGDAYGALTIGVNFLF